MPLAKAAPSEAAPAPRILVTKVFVRGLALEAEIGVYPHELGRRQPLIVDVELDVAAAGWRHLGDTVNYAEFAIPLTPGSTTNFGTLMTGKFPAVGSGSTMTGGADAVSGDVTISFAAGASIFIDTLVYDSTDLQKLRTVRVPINAQTSPLLPCPDCGFQLLYGLTPAATILCPTARVTVALPHQNQSPNDFGWKAGAAVEFWVMTTDTGQQYAPYAGWRKISGGVVSADGTSVSTNSGEGFEYLDNFAIRLRP